MEELKNMNLHGLFRFLHMSDSDFENWLKDNKLLFRQRKCECGRDMAYKWNHARPNDPLWVCNSKKITEGRPQLGDIMTPPFFWIPFKTKTGMVILVVGG